MPISSLSPDRLYHRCRPDQLDFDTTEELEPVETPVGQPRAAEALCFGFGIEREGYNIFALGEPGTGKYTLIRRYLDKRAASDKVPPDICYVNNVEDDHKPKILTVSPGRGKELEKDMREIVENVQRALRAAFETEDYQNRRQAINQEFQEKQQEAFEELKNEAAKYDLTIMRTPGGLSFAPVKDDEVVSPEEFDKLPDEERQRLEDKVQELQKEAANYQNLVGRVEHQAQMGALVTDFNMIRAGALLRANGGYLILDALKVLRDPFAWEGLKRAGR